MTKLTHGHTERDWTTMAALDPELPARTQPREHSVRCSCGRATWNQGGACDAHYRLPGAVVALIGRRWPTLTDVPGARCRSCGASITWARTVTGKTMPIDRDPVDGGNVVFTGRRVEAKDGALILECRVEVGTPMFDDGIDRFVSHFATCPQAASWRKP